MASRFRLTSDATAPAVSPTAQSYTHDQGTRRILKLTDTSTLTTSAYTPDAADDLVAGDALHIQFVSNPLNAGPIFTLADTLKYCVQGLEAHANNNLRVWAYVSVVDEAGTTVRATLRTKAAGTTELAGTLTSRFTTTTLTVTPFYTLVAGDRLVVEIHVTGTPAASGGVQGHNASLRWGSGGAAGDLLENDTETGTTRDPWIEFATTVTEQSGTQDLTGTLFTNAPTFSTGAVTPGAVNLAGTLFANTATFFTGAITSVYGLSGVLYQNPPTFFTGTVTPGAVTLTGSLFVNTPTFFTGTVTPGAVTLTGSLFANSPTFFTGAISVGVVDLAGVLFVNTLVFFNGLLEQDVGPQLLGGSLFVNTPTFPQGAITTGAVNLDGVLFDNPPIFNTGTVVTGYELAGVLYENLSAFFLGVIASGDLVLGGTLFVNDPIFVQGVIVGVDRVYPFWPTTTDDAWLAATDDGWPVGSEVEWQGV